MLDGDRKCLLKKIYNIFDCVYRCKVFWYINRKVLNWIVFREKSDNCLKCLWFIWDQCRFLFVERKCMFDGDRKCLLKKIYNIFDCVYRCKVFWYINRKVLNWIVFREKSDNCLKCLWFIWDQCRFLFVERKCMFDGDRKCLLKKIYNIFDCVYRCKVFWYINRKVLNWIVFREKSDNCLKCLWFIWDPCRFWFVERKCMLDGDRKYCWRRFIIYLIAFTGIKCFDI